jgi:citron Rho-interacting kinase
MDATIQDRLSYLRVGSHGDNSLPDHSMVRLGHSPALDGLSALYYECKGSSTLSKDKKISKFLSKYKVAMEEYEKLRVKANDFNVKGIIGQGHFGEVRVVEENETKGIYAMKMMRKDHILQQVDAAFYLEERDIMAYSNSQWLTKLHCAFQDDQCLYLVMEYHPGGDLLNVMERNDGGMGEMEASFYLAEIVCAVNDLHMLGYVHRDLKPDNVLISTDGHIKLVDFGSASRLNNGVVVNTSLPVGTPQYISPEVLTSLDGKVPYGTCCDWWSLGIILYEMIFDVTPFEGSTTPETYNNIMNYKTTLHFPSDVVISEDVRHLISNLLIGSELRLSHDDIIKHSFFASIDWDNITSMVPPFVPVLSGPDDTSHFDSFQPLDDPNDKSFTYKSTRVFTGRNLPFVGFTFTPNNNGGTRNDDGISPLVTSQLDEMVKDIRKALEKTQKDLRSSQEQKELALKECNIYKKQLEDLQDKLEIERKDRRVSDSKALKLLSEVREQNKVAQEMRQSQAKEITEQVNGAVNQLEKERESAVKRLNWTQKELKKKQLEVDACTAKVSDLRCKLSQGRDSWKVLEANFKIKLDKLAEDYRQRANALQKDYTEIQEKYSLVSKELKTSREEVIKLENQLNSVKMASTGDTITDGDSHGDGCQSDDREEDKLLMESVQNELEMERCKMKQLNDKYNEMALHFKMLEQSLETEKLEREKIEMNKWNITKDYNAALEEVESLRKDKVTLTASCEQLKADMNTIQQQVEKYQLEIKCLKDEHSAVNPMTDGGSLQQENTVLEGEKEYLMKLSNLKDKVSEKDINIKKLNEQVS